MTNKYIVVDYRKPFSVVMTWNQCIAYLREYTWKLEAPDIRHVSELYDLTFAN